MIESPIEPREIEIEDVAGYEPGVCNIGPAEIARRRRSGHVGVAATLGLFGVLVATGAPRPLRLAVALPAVVAASGYLQARAHFCANFGARGLYNFDEVGETLEVVDAEARAADRARSMQIGLGSAAIGVATGIAAALLPV